MKDEGRAAWFARCANINKPAVAISGWSHLLSYHLVLLWKTDLPPILFVIVCICVSMHPNAHLCTSLFDICASKNHQSVRLSEQKHTSGFIQDAWNSSPAWFRLLPEPPCCLRIGADKLCRSTQCLAYSTHNWKGLGWQRIEVKLSLQSGSGCKQA